MATTGDTAEMAYDEELAERIREVVAGEDAVSEQRMFGGLAFLIGGNMAAAASGQGGLMVRVDPSHTDGLVDGLGVEPMVMRGRAMRGWLRVSDDAVRDDVALREWVGRGVAYARSLPPKGG